MGQPFQSYEISSFLRGYGSAVTVVADGYSFHDAISFLTGGARIVAGRSFQYHEMMHLLGINSNAVTIIAAGLKHTK